MDPSQMDALVEALAEKLTPMLVDRVIEKIASEADDPDMEGMDDLGMEGEGEMPLGLDDGLEDGLEDDLGDDMGGEPMPGEAPEDAEGEEMSATGASFLPGMAGEEGGAGDEEGDTERHEDDFEDDDLDDEDLDDLDDEDDEEGEGGDEEMPPDDEDDEQYMAGDKMIPGKSKVRHESHCDPKGRGMSKSKSKSQYDAGRGDGIALDRYSGDDATLVRYQAAMDQSNAKIQSLEKKLERYSTGYTKLVGELVRRDRIKELEDLKGEGYELDIADELKLTERYSHDEFSGHCERIRKNYRQVVAEDDYDVPVGQPRRTSPEVHADDLVRYASEDLIEDLTGLSADQKALRVMTAAAARVRGA